MAEIAKSVQQRTKRSFKTTQSRHLFSSILYQIKALSFSCSDVYADYRSPQSTESLFCDLQILYTQNCILPLQQKTFIYDLGL
jgi:hypothetical protein